MHSRSVQMLAGNTMLNPMSTSLNSKDINIPAPGAPTAVHGPLYATVTLQVQESIMQLFM